MTFPWWHRQWNLDGATNYGVAIRRLRQLRGNHAWHRDPCVPVLEHRPERVTAARGRVRECSYFKRYLEEQSRD